MLGIKDLKKELAETNAEMKAVSSQILKMAENILVLSKDMSESMKNMTNELHDTNLSLRDSLKTNFPVSSVIGIAPSTMKMETIYFNVCFVSIFNRS